MRTEVAPRALFDMMRFRPAEAAGRQVTADQLAFLHPVVGPGPQEDRSVLGGCQPGLFQLVLT